MASGVGATHGERERPAYGLRDRFEARSAGIPFRVRLGIVYAVITVVLVLLFAAFQFDTTFMREWFPYFLAGVPLTLIICVGGILLAIPLALIGALGRLSKVAVFHGLSNFYVSFIRGTPLIVQIFFIYYAFPQLAYKPAFPPPLRFLLVYDIVFAGILALGINYGAYMTEIFRAGIQSIGHGQIEAAHALGMNRTQTNRRIVLPQAIRVIIPPTGNEFIAMLKDSALVGLAGTTELFFRVSQVGRSEAHPFEALVVAAAIYWLLTGVFSFFQKKLERRFERGHVREAAHGH